MAKKKDKVKIWILIAIAALFIMNAPQSKLSKKGAGSAWCYQENANHASDCGGLGTGSYAWDGVYLHIEDVTQTTPENFYDGNWNTYVYSSGSGTINIVYSKPVGALPSSMFMLKNNVNDNLPPRNHTIPAACLEQADLKIKLVSNGAEGLTVTCYDGINWATIMSESGGSAIDLFEEAMWWDIGVIGVCTDTTWTPETSTACSSTTITQTSNCGTPRTASGTKTCITSSEAESNYLAGTATLVVTVNNMNTWVNA